MRGAGCVMNDMIDRRLDAQVERTATRPLASGEMSLATAAAIFIMLLLVSLCIALLLGWNVTLGAAAALPLVLLYPFMKRVTWWPQLFLGLTFNWGALLGWIFQRGECNFGAFALYVAGIFWTLGYDTIYAHQDKADDAKIGIKSTALRLGEHTKKAVTLFYTLMLGAFIVAGVSVQAAFLYYIIIALCGAHAAWQVAFVHLDTPASCLRIFKSNVWFGAWVTLACLAA